MYSINWFHYLIILYIISINNPIGLLIKGYFYILIYENIDIAFTLHSVQCKVYNYSRIVLSTIYTIYCIIYLLEYIVHTPYNVYIYLYIPFTIYMHTIYIRRMSYVQYIIYTCIQFYQTLHTYTHAHIHHIHVQIQTHVYKHTHQHTHTKTHTYNTH